MTAIGFSFADPSAGIRQLFAQLALSSVPHACCDSFAVQARSRYVGGMQGKLIIAILVAAMPGTAALAGEPQRRQGCPRGEQIQQRQQQSQQQVAQRRNNKPQGCTIVRSIPAVVDQTPMFIL